MWYGFNNNNLKEKTLSAPKNARFNLLRILLLICYYMFGRSYRRQGAYTDVGKPYNNKIIFQ